MTVASTSAPVHIERGLPNIITGIAFWSMVLIGALTAAMLLQGQDKAQQERNIGNGILLAHQLGDVLELQPTAPLLAGNRQRLERLAARLKKELGFEALMLTSGGESWRFGELHPAQSVVTHALTLAAKQAGAQSLRLEVSVYYPNLFQSVIEQRKNILLGIGIVIIALGLVLQKILQRLLSQPFADMVACAARSADGDDTARFDDDRPDEFGFLAKFINRSLDSQSRQRQELRETLTRAQHSEAALSREKIRAEVTLHSIVDAVITTSATTRIQYMNPAAEELTGWRNEEAQGLLLESVVHIVHEITGEKLPNPLHACLQNDKVKVLNQHAALLRRDGETIAIETSAAPMHNDSDGTLGAVMVFQDVRHTRLLTRQLSHQASHDLLTGLFNRLKFEERLNALLAETASDSGQHALLYLDLDQFKIVNDTSGHVAGDELLRQVAATLLSEVRADDTLARLGGDEFGVLLKNCPLVKAREIAEKLREHIHARRFAWHDKTFEIGVSIGVVAITAATPDSTSILSAADLSCYAAKDMGRNRIHVYEPTDATLAQRHGEMRWATLLVEALNENRFLLFRQAIRGIASGNVGMDHYEILIRMRDVDGGIVLPGSFIPAAERYNLMPGIDRWVIHHTFAAIAAGAFGLSASGAKHMIAINLSGASLGDDGLLGFIREKRDEFSISFDEVCFEVTETVAISNLSRATHLIRELRTLGCRFALDDFGSGLSSFAYLKNLPLDYIKIDGGFVKDIARDPIDRAMVEAIAQIGKIMKIETIAEWVEDEATLTILKEIGIDFAQGYLIEKPCPIQLTNLPSHPVEHAPASASVKPQPAAKLPVAASARR